MIKRAVSFLPLRLQQALRRIQFRRQILSGRFRTPEPEWDSVEGWLKPGDWVIDVGANVGHYSSRFSDLVGAHGRVFAFEPVPDTFQILTANSAAFRYPNVTLMNSAASDGSALFAVSIPKFETGLLNYYEAALTASGDGVRVFTLSLDSMNFPERIRLVKIDAEGHDLNVLLGAKLLIERDHPIFIIESGLSEVASLLAGYGYSSSALNGSPNTIYRCAD